MKQVKAKPLAGSVVAGLVASVCCGGSLIFASVGLGAFYGALGLWRYVPQVLAAGALSIVAINYLYYRRLTKHALLSSERDLVALRQGMFVSASLGIAAMAVSFVFLEWFNHAVVNPHRFLSRPEYGQALIPGVPNIRLFYALASFSALALLWALPFPRPLPERAGAETALRQGLRVGVLVATVGVLVWLGVSAVRPGGKGGHIGVRHSSDRVPQYQSSPHTRP